MGVDAGQLIGLIGPALQLANTVAARGQPGRGGPMPMQGFTAGGPLMGAMGGMPMGATAAPMGGGPAPGGVAYQWQAGYQ
ncbi:MAG: hypothetical protein AAB037_05715, partial [Chloroflexota bacterium]